MRTIWIDICFTHMHRHMCILSMTNNGTTYAIPAAGSSYVPAVYGLGTTTV